MSKTELKNIISECCNDVLFSYNGMASGITSTVSNYKPTFQVWHGDKTKEYSDVDDVMEDSFYSGKSINDLIDKINFTFV